MTIRTWRQGTSLLASAAGEDLTADALAAAATHARRRWPHLPVAPGLLLADDLDQAQAVARERPELVAEARQVAGLSDGWAIAWIDPESLEDSV